MITARFPSPAFPLRLPGHVVLRIRYADSELVVVDGLCDRVGIRRVGHVSVADEEPLGGFCNDMERMA